MLYPVKPPISPLLSVLQITSRCSLSFVPTSFTRLTCLPEEMRYSCSTPLSAQRAAQIQTSVVWMADKCKSEDGRNDSNGSLLDPKDYTASESTEEEPENKNLWPRWDCRTFTSDWQQHAILTCVLFSCCTLQSQLDYILSLKMFNNKLPSYCQSTLDDTWLLMMMSRM